MLLAFGWVVTQTSLHAYNMATCDEQEVILDDMNVKDIALFESLEQWLELNDDGWLKWQFTPHLNNHSGLLQFHTSRNHRTSVVWRLMEFISQQSLGSYGAVYIHDDEDIDRDAFSDFEFSYRVWRILDGKITEHDDQLFSPFKSLHAFCPNAND